MDSRPACRGRIVPSLQKFFWKGSMDTTTLTLKLIQLGMKKTEFAKMMKMNVATLYHWKEVPGYAEAIIGLLERIRKLEDK